MTCIGWSSIWAYGSAHLVAAAQGGFFALDYALHYPERVRSLAIVSSLMGVTDPDYVAVNERLRPPFFASLPHDFQELSPSYRAGNPQGLAAWRVLDEQAIPARRITPRVRQPLTWAMLETIRHPTLLLTGDSDLYTPPALLRMQAQHMPHAQVHIVAEAGHSPYWEQPTAFNDAPYGIPGKRHLTTVTAPSTGTAGYYLAARRDSRAMLIPLDMTPT
jgi:pimeloyl-ACP methyl ester carboxylesterase